MDGEGLVVKAQHIWVAAEGRQQPAQPAALLRYDMSTGSLLSSRELPPDWRLQPNRGLRSNGDPESLSRSPADGALLMATDDNFNPLQRSHLAGWCRASCWAARSAAVDAHQCAASPLPGHCAFAKLK